VNYIISVKSIFIAAIEKLQFIK